MMKLKTKRKIVPLRSKIETTLRVIVIPGFGGIPLYDVLVFFFNGLFKGELPTRASAVAFSFFLAIFPFILFLFTLIPYIPIDQFQQKLFELFADVIPPDTFATVEKTIFEIVMHQNSGLLSLSFVLTFIFSTNGISAIIDGFNGSWHKIPTRSFIQQRLVAIFLLIVLSVMVVVAIAVLTLGGQVIEWLIEFEAVKDSWLIALLQVLKWFISLSLTFFSVSFLYYFAPAERKKYRFFSPGSILATILLIIGTLAFNFYISNFSNYNALYGSIGTLIIFLMWLFFNSLILLVGFELNTSIYKAKQEPISKGKGKKHEKPVMLK